MSTSSLKAGPFVYDEGIAWLLPCAVLMVVTGTLLLVFLASRAVLAAAFLCEFEPRMRWTIALPLGIGAGCFAAGIARVSWLRLVAGLLVFTLVALGAAEAVHLVYATRCPHPVYRNVADRNPSGFGTAVV